jgi:amidase
MPSEMRDYKVIAAEKKAQQWEKIPKEWRISAEKYQDETNVSTYNPHFSILP